MLSLYRRHRPRSFDEVVGQEHIVRTMRNAVGLDRVHHAYLFVGSRGTGKTSMAKLLACALNADDGPRADFSPDDPACAAIMAGTSLDVVEMDAASNNSVDDIRELRENVVLAPMGGRRRVYILDEAHMLSTAAWNAFLKTLEEPPPHVVFVLATTEAHKVPDTIVDRCHRFDFHRPSLEQVAEVLRRVAEGEGIQLPDAAVGMIARAATGSFRDALGTLEQLVTYGGKQVRLEDVLEILGVADAELVLDTAESLAEHDPKAALMAVERLSGSGRDLPQFMRDFAAHLRHLFVVQTIGEVPSSFSVTAEHTDRLRSQAELIPQAELLRAIDLLAAGLAAVKDGSEPRIQLELALLKAVQPHADLSLQALMFRVEALERRLESGLPDPVGESVAEDGDASGQPAPQHEGEREGDPQPAHDGGQPPGVTPPAPAEGAAGERTATATGEGTPSAGERTATEPAAAPRTDGEAAAAEPSLDPVPVESAGSTSIDLESVRALWPAAVDAVRLDNAMVGALLAQARPVAVDGGRLTVAFPHDAAFSKKKAEANRSLLQAALRGVTGCSLAVAYELRPPEDSEPAPRVSQLSEDELLERLKRDFGAEEVFDDEPRP